MNLKDRYKSLPISARRMMGLGAVLALVVALPLFVWAIINLNFNQNKKAASGEPDCVINGAEFMITFVHVDSINPIRLDYELSMRNLDTSLCAPTTYIMEVNPPTGWTGQFVSDAFNLNPGGSYGDNHLYMTAPVGFNTWPQTFVVSYHASYPDGHTGSQTITYTYGDIPLSPTPTASPTASPTVTASPTATATATTAPIAGDVNGDGIINIVDIGIIVEHYGEGSSSFPSADLNGDGTINVVDIQIVIDNY